MVCISSQLLVFASEKTGSLHLKMKNSEDVASVEVYQVADYENGDYVLNEAFAEKMDDKEIARFQNLNGKSVKAEVLEENANMFANMIATQDLKAYDKKEVKGELTLSNMPLGMYLVVGNVKNTKQALLPSLFGVPYWNVSHQLVYDVEAFAKVGDQPEKPQPKPDQPVKPKPGGSNTATETHFYLYAILLAASSLVLFLMVRKHHYEAK